MENITARILEFECNENRTQIHISQIRCNGGNLFRFYRGTNHYFYEDLSNLEHKPGSPQVLIWVALYLKTLQFVR